MTKLNDDILASTGNTAKEQEMFFAGVEAGEANAKNNADVCAAPAAPVSTVEQDEQAAFERWFDRTCPSGDVEAVQRQWEASSDYDEFHAPAAGDALTAAARDVLAERHRQISVEGWTPEHDDAHTDGALAQAAACYAASSQSRDISYMAHLWPWSTAWWKPGTSRGDLLKAGALILAEIERQDRARAAFEAQRKGDA